MRIGIDGYNLALPHGTGVATFGFVLANTLRELGHETNGVFGIDVGRNPSAREAMFFGRLGRNLSAERTRSQAARHRRKIFRHALLPVRRLRTVPQTGLIENEGLAARLPRFTRLTSSADLFEIAHRHFTFYGRFLVVYDPTPPDIMHWTYPVPVRYAGCPNIYTFHDLIPLKLPFTTLDDKDHYRRLVQRCADTADHICTVSERSRMDIIEALDVAPARITNTYQASPMLDQALRPDPADDGAMIEGLFGLRRDGYHLFYGAIEPKKNVGRLIEGFLAAQSDVPLVIVGGGWSSGEDFRLLTQGTATLHGRRLARRVIRLDHLPRALLLRLIRGARAVAFPSLYEGFGLPLLEAMQLGVPVLASSTGSLPEVAGKAAVLVDPYDVRSIADGISRLDGDRALRDRLRVEGPKQAARFSVAAYGQRLESLYAAALTRRSDRL